MMKPTSIKPHRKNRTGCRTCKRRKIRCDEQRPACLNCIKHSVNCDFTDAQPSTSSASNSNTYLSPSGTQDVAAIPSPQGQRQLSVPTVPAPLSDLKMLDLELMHNYCTSTSYSLTSSPILRSVFRLSVPQLCLEHPFLMRSLLALSALHISHHSPSRRDFLLSYAIAQHRSASQTASTILANITAENCVPIYIFSILTYIFAMATPVPQGSNDFLLVSDSGVADWIYLIRGTREIVTLNHSSLSSSTFGPMFTAGARRHHLRTIDKSPHKSLSTLLFILRNTAESPSNNTTPIISAQKIAIYEFAIEELRKTFSVVNKAASEGDLQITDISIWVFNATDGYLALLRERDGPALVILSYFCVLLRRFEGYWWMAGKGAHILSSIYKLVDEECRLLMSWPMEEIGWLPPGSGESRQNLTLVDMEMVE